MPAEKPVYSSLWAVSCELRAISATWGRIVVKMQSVAGTTGKDTIYVDIDDEITAIIDKVRSSRQKIVALVLPKRATVLQSIVNMKLLKRTAEDANKHLVLITSEPGLLPLAGGIGLYVASTLQSKPEIPKPPELPDDADETIDEPLAVDEPAEDEFDAEAAANKPVGELASGKAAPAATGSITLDDEATATSDAPITAVKKNKKLKVPNFNSFRNRILLAIVVLIVLIGGWILADVVLPHAIVRISTDTSTIPTNLSLTLDTQAQALDPAADVVPAAQQTSSKTFTQTVPTTGQQNNGQKATGSVTMTACENGFNFAQSVPAGTGISVNGHTYITQVTTQFSHSGSPNGNCFTYQATGPTQITAINGGKDYNVDNANFTVSSRSDVSANGSASGGTDQFVPIVAQADIDNAKSKIGSSDTSGVQQDLKSGLQAKGLYPISATFTAGTPQVTTSNNVGDQANNVTVTEVITYSMLGVKKSDLQTLVDNNVKKQIDPTKQVILSDGVDKANFNVQDQPSPTTLSVAMTTKATAGPELNVASIKKQVAGKKAGDVVSMLKDIPGVTDVQVKYSPFWVSNVPKNTAKITVQLDKANAGKS